MKKARFTESQIMGILKEAGAGVTVNEIWRKHGISSATYYKWKAKYGGLEASAPARRAGRRANRAETMKISFGFRV